MHAYLDLVQHILTHGEQRGDRTKTGTLSVFGHQTRYDLREGFPILTTKKVLFSAVVRELLWFLRGSTNIHDDLSEHTPIWNAWADNQGNLGPIYGYQWRHWPDNNAQGIDQIDNAIDLIKNNPQSRRIIVSAWNVAQLDQMALPPCHLMFQFYVTRDQCLDLQLYQRSADVALGVPFNIASYALLLTMMAQECNLTPRFFIHTLGDAHIYLNHIEGITTQMNRTPYEKPTLTLTNKPLEQITFDDVSLSNYKHHDFISFPIAV